MKRMTDEEIEKHLENQTKLLAEIVTTTYSKTPRTYDDAKAICEAILAELTTTEQPAVESTIQGQGVTQITDYIARAEKAEAEVKRLEEELSTVQNSLAIVVGVHTKTLAERDELKARIGEAVIIAIRYGVADKSDLLKILRGETEGGE